MLQLIDFFQEMGFKITFSSAALQNEFSADLKILGIQEHPINLNSDSFDAFILQLNPQLVVFDRFVTEEQFGWRVTQNCPNAIRILDTEDLHCLRLARQASFKAQLSFDLSDLLSEPTAFREIASIYRCDLSLIVSEFEMKVLQQTFSIDKQLLYYLPLLVPDNFQEQQTLAFESRTDFVFIGNFLHEPNWNAVQVLKSEIWNGIRSAIPEASLHIYGAYPSGKVFQLHNPKQHFYIEGRAESSKEVISNARILLAPLQFGAGIKGKLLEAMQYGTPSITTPIGAEGMQGEFSWNGNVCNTNSDFIAAAIDLYQNKSSWIKAQSNGFEIVRKRFLVSQNKAAFISFFLEFMSTIATHRKQNFMGNLLAQQQFQSTKYLSLWITEKNKNQDAP